MNSKFDSISDDDLFGSGCDSLDLNSLITSDVSGPVIGNAANTMTLQNQDESKNRSSNIRSQPQVPHPMPGSSRSTEDAFHPVYEPAPIQVPSPLRWESTATGARAKVIKNKENKNKNTAKKSVKNGENKVIPPQFRPRDQTSVWEPVLQLKQYDADDDETSLLKPVNISKQKRQNKNKNAPKSKSAPLMSTSSVSSDNDFLSLDSIPLPAHLNPKDVKHHVYIKRVNNVQNRIVLQNGEEEIAHSSHSDNKNDNVLSVNTIQPHNITSIRNNLWEGQRKGKKQTNEDNISVRFSPSNNQAVHVVNNDIEMDMESQQSGLHIPNPRHLSGAHSGSRLDNPIVVPYETEAQNQHALRMDNIPCNTEPATCDNVHALNFNSSSNSVPNALVDEFSDSLPSNMSSNILFGDGLSNDFLFAQQLQRKYDRENEEIQRNRQFDVPTNFHRFSEQPSNQQRNLITQPSPSDNNEPSEDVNVPVNESLNTLDFVTAFHSLDDSLNNGRGSVYAPGDIENPSQHSEPIVIPFENQRDSNEAGHEESTERVNEPIVVTIPYDRIQNDDLYPETVSVRGNIHIPLNEDFGISNLPQPSCVESAGNLVARGSRSPRQQDGQTDAELARLLQEQQDEELARQLQEEDERTSHSSFMGRNNTRTIPHVRHRHSEPLRQRFSDTWNRRPLLVPIGALNNNVADSQSRRPYTSSERPLVTGSGNEFSYLDNVHSRPLHEGYDIPPGPDYYYRIENDPDYMLDEYGEDRLISINRDPQLLASLLMTRDPEMMIPPNVDLNDYEALWELAENLGEVRRVGMDQDDISLLPVHCHEGKSKESTSDGIDCLVCLSEFKAGEQLKTLPCCHVYHVQCIDEWLKRNAICPVCRQSAKQGDNQQSN